MIVSKPNPSLFLGSVATSVHAPSFRCFVSTARRSLFSSVWETVIFDGDPGVDREWKACARFRYRPSLNKQSIWQIHAGMSERMNALAESGKGLGEVLSLVLPDLVQRNIIEQSSIRSAF